MSFADRAALALLLAVAWPLLFALDVGIWWTLGEPWDELRAVSDGAFDRWAERVREA
jgi:hypothetical protein